MESLKQWLEELGQAVTEIPYDESDSLRVGAMGRIDAFLR
jgi:hypothetical protein